MVNAQTEMVDSDVFVTKVTSFPRVDCHAVMLMNVPRIRLCVFMVDVETLKELMFVSVSQDTLIHQMEVIAWMRMSVLPMQMLVGLTEDASTLRAPSGTVNALLASSYLRRLSSVH